MTYDDVLHAAKSLSPHDQGRLIDELWESAEQPLEMPPSAEWIAEAQRRSAEYDAENMPTSSWPEVRERVRREAGLER